VVVGVTEDQGRTLFFGNSEHAVDAKGRIAIPARFRDQLKGKGDERLVITPAGKCLAVYPYEVWLSIADKVGALSAVEERVQDFRRLFFSSSHHCSLDKQGRVLIPQKLREFAGLNDGAAVVLGVQNKFELWSKDRWDEWSEGIQESYGGLSSAMAEYGL
jgi:MraZ protein